RFGSHLLSLSGFVGLVQGSVAGRPRCAWEKIGRMTLSSREVQDLIRRTAELQEQARTARELVRLRRVERTREREQWISERRPDYVLLAPQASAARAEP